MITHDGYLRIVDDFKAFCNFVETEKPHLTEKKNVLGNKDAFAVNSRLHFNRDISEARYQQEHYLCLDLLFTLALEGHLFKIVKDEKGKMSLQSTNRFAAFMSLNKYEQFTFLLETYWCHYNFSGLLNSMLWVGKLLDMQQLFMAFLEKGAGKSITRKDYLINRDLKRFFTFDFMAVLQLVCFDFCTCELNEEALKYDDPKFLAITPTPLGVTLANILLIQGLPYRLESYLSPSYRILAANQKIEMPPKGLHMILAKAFSPGAVTQTVDPELPPGVAGNYYFKAALRKNLWRIIKLNHTHTLADLHLAIQAAYYMDYDHLYAFYLDFNESGRNKHVGIYCREMEGEVFIADEIPIVKCGFSPGQAFFYLYDFGDKIMFDITLLEVNGDEPPLLRPFTVKEKGESPFL